MTFTLPVPYGLALTGRIQDYLKTGGYGRLPVSCTVYVVRDSMEGDGGIEASWLFASKALRYAAGVAIHLSELRPKGTKNAKGLTASGPVSFAKIYSLLNETLRRGGIFKNGASTLHLDYSHPDVMDYVNTPRSELRWAKRCLDVDAEGKWLDYFTTEQLADIMIAIMRGDLWLAKITYDEYGNRIYANVCLEILLKSQGTCLLAHQNLGLLKEHEIVDAFVNGMRWLCEFHPHTGVGEQGIYLNPSVDKQVGLGVLGLSNYLAINGITYRELTQALEKELGISTDGAPSLEALSLARTLIEAYNKAGAVAKSYGMERAFTVAPTATCSYKQRDRFGYITSPEIAPPVALAVERDSGTLGTVTVEYNPSSEIAYDVGWDTMFRLNVAWQTMMEQTGLAHAISMNWWSDVVSMNKPFLKRWSDSPLLSLYYAMQVRPDTLDKSEVLTEAKILATTAVSAPNREVIEFEPPAEEYKLPSPSSDGGFCSACSE